MKTITSLKAWALGAGIDATLAGGLAGPSAAQDHSSLPKMIQLPEPREETQFTEETQGEIWFNSRAPFEFDMLLSNLDEVPELSTFGYLFLPHGASAENPVPAMIVLPGSGGLKLGRDQPVYEDTNRKLIRFLDEKL